MFATNSSDSCPGKKWPGSPRKATRRLSGHVAGRSKSIPPDAWNGTRKEADRTTRNARTVTQPTGLTATGEQKRNNLPRTRNAPSLPAVNRYARPMLAPCRRRGPARLVRNIVICWNCLMSAQRAQHFRFQANPAICRILRGISWILVQGNAFIDHQLRQSLHSPPMG